MIVRVLIIFALLAIKGNCVPFRCSKNKLEYLRISSGVKLCDDQLNEFLESLRKNDKWANDSKKVFSFVQQC